MSTRTPIAGPDVICVGLPKAGTTWLFNQLNGHPDFWMPPGKELRFFIGGDFPPVHVARAANAYRSEAAAGGAGKFSERDVAFFETLPWTLGKERDFDVYASLFSAKGELLSGDVSPIYAALRGRDAARIAARFDRTRIVALLRDPVERAWSHWRMKLSMNDAASDDALQDAVALRAFLSSRTMIARSKPSRVVKVWSKAAGARFRYFFLEDIAARPAETRADILAFIGADPAKDSRHAAAQNRNAAPKVERSPKVRTVMRELFADERQRCARLLGGPALRWPDASY